MKPRWVGDSQTVTERSFLEEEAWGPCLHPQHLKNPPPHPRSPRHTHIRVRRGQASASDRPGLLSLIQLFANDLGKVS